MFSGARKNRLGQDQLFKKNVKKRKKCSQIRKSAIHDVKQMVLVGNVSDGFNNEKCVLYFWISLMNSSTPTTSHKMLQTAPRA